jgi:4-diphosphocytidyl-2-C-methyl-D-erythritol kinase
MFFREISDTSVTIDAPAKVNLFLEILNRRSDGYHNINSVFQAVSLYDRIELTVTDQPGVSIELVGERALTIGNDNLIAAAFHLIQKRFGIRQGLKARLLKRIPIAAGLGGGSADGAATILACNILFGLGLGWLQLIDLARHLGSDVPFFLTRGQARVTGRGDIVEEIELPTDYHMVLVNPAFELSTSESYAQLKRALTMYKNPFNLAPCARAGDLVRSLGLTSNDFEEVHLKSYPELGRIKEGLLRSGASLARMTGSGPTIFGIFFGAPETLKGENLDWGNWQVYTVMPVTLPSKA